MGIIHATSPGDEQLMVIKTGPQNVQFLKTISGPLVISFTRKHPINAYLFRENAKNNRLGDFDSNTPPMSGDTSTRYDVGIVGATGAVGIELVKCLFKRNFPVGKLILYASMRTAGTTVTTDYGDVVIQPYSIEEARKCQIVFLAVSGDFALANAKELCEDDGPVVIDNSSAFRYDPDIPLVVSFIVMF